MASYTVKKMPDQLRKDLKVQAAKEDTSMNKTILKAIDEYIKRQSDVPFIDLDEVAWNNIRAAVPKSNWIPPEYAMGDWVSDVISFLVHGERR